MEIQTKGKHIIFNAIDQQNFPTLKNGMENQIQEAYRTLNVQNYNRPTSWQMPRIQNKDKIIKVVRGKKSDYI